MQQGHEIQSGDFAEMTAFERYGVKISEKVNMHNKHWLTSTRFSPFSGPWMNKLIRGYVSKSSAAFIMPRVFHFSAFHYTVIMCFKLILSHKTTIQCIIPYYTMYLYVHSVHTKHTRSPAYTTRDFPSTIISDSW